MDTTPTVDTPIRELALALHELSWRLTRLGPARAGLDPLPSSELAVLRAIGIASNPQGPQRQTRHR